MFHYCPSIRKFNEAAQAYIQKREDVDYMKIRTITAMTAALLLGMSAPSFAQNKGGDGSAAESGKTQQQKAPQRKLSAAEKAILMPGHWDNLDGPVRIRYNFEKTGSYEDGFKDRVIMDVKELHKDGTADIDLDFFSGQHEVTFIQPHNENDVPVNSTIFIYLQGDVFEMTRLTDRKPQVNFYFNKKIRSALVNQFESESVKVPYKGEQVAATKYTITPYAEDPNRVDYDKFADKKYEFIMSEAIPGKLYKIRTVIPNNTKDNAPPLIEETLTFASVQPLEQKSAKKN